MKGPGSFLKKLAIFVATSHVAVALSLHLYRKSQLRDDCVEEKKLLGWLTYANGVPLIKDIASNVKSLKRLKAKAGDVCITSYPKSGTTWLSEIVDRIQRGHLDVTSKVKLDERVPYLEWFYSDVDEINRMLPPRTMKSHLPLQLLPEQLKKGKIIYIWRNPRDVAVSYYYFTKMIKIVGYNGEFNKFYDLYLSGDVAYGKWSSHVVKYWELAQMNPNVLIISYEQLSQDPVSEIQRIGKFLNKPLTREQAVSLSQSCNFTSMKDNETTNYEWLNDVEFKYSNVPFMRKGIVGDWRNYFSEEMITSCDQMVQSDISDPILKAFIIYSLPKSSDY